MSRIILTLAILFSSAAILPLGSDSLSLSELSPAYGDVDLDCNGSPLDNDSNDSPLLPTNVLPFQTHADDRSVGAQLSAVLSPLLSNSRIRAPPRTS